MTLTDINKELKQIIEKGGTSRERYNEIIRFAYRLYVANEISEDQWFSLLEAGRKLLGIERRRILLDRKRKIYRGVLTFPEEAMEGGGKILNTKGDII